MTTHTVPSWNTLWEKVWPWIEGSPYLATLVYIVTTGAAEGNGMAIPAFFFLAGAYVLCLFVNEIYCSPIPGVAESAKDRLARRLLILVYLLLPLVALFLSCIHLASDGKVWIIDGKTTLTHDALLRIPGSDYAKSVDKNQDITLSLLSTTKDGAPLAGNVRIAFRLTDNEEVILHGAGRASDPDKVIADGQALAIKQVFGQVVGERNLTQIVSDERIIEYELGSRLILDWLGVKRNGNVTLYNLRVSFVDK